MTAAAVSVQHPAPPDGRLRVLAIDDHPIVLQALRSLIETDGHRVTLRDSGPAGIEAFELALSQGMPFDAVITDFGMPGMDGGEVARRVKQSHPVTRVVMLTGWGPGINAGGDWQQCVDVFLGKPARLADVRKALAGARSMA